MPIAIFPTSMSQHQMSEQFGAPQASRGLTLLELLVVMTILALVAATATVRLTGVQHRAELELALDRLTHIDGQLRGHAERHRRAVELHIQLRENVVELDMADVKNRTTLKKVLGRNIVVERFVSAVQDVDRGEVIVGYLPNGTAESYAILVSGPGDRRKWLFVAGGSGQITRHDELGELEDALQKLIPTGVHAG